ncbi:hypothetical protein DPMN_045990 [Dreissena polymorpha]|uniref:Uncharacterized protein n=1 Tax=Dreissena polymorpha TaxID=45954 RepID=A0A9D4D8S5_DREPO|nr:hypothetical protein DPMN_045990 [Dreissena polymorpha]
MNIHKLKSRKYRQANNKCIAVSTEPRHAEMNICHQLISRSHCTFAQSGQELPCPLMWPRNLARLKADIVAIEQTTRLELR